MRTHWAFEDLLRGQSAGQGLNELLVTEEPDSDVHVDFLCFTGTWGPCLSRVTELALGQVVSTSPGHFQSPNDGETGFTEG